MQNVKREEGTPTATQTSNEVRVFELTTLLLTEAT